MSIKLHRRCDAAIRKIRHIDGIIDTLWGKAKAYFEDLKRKLSSVGWGRKILFILGKILKVTSVATIGANAASLVKAKLELERRKRLVKSLFETIGNAGVGEEIASGARIAGLSEHVVVQFCNLCTAIIGYAIEKAAIPDKV